jgi:G3E family GTPase
VIVTGFLGAGKTTLVNALLARRAARGATGKLGVVVNELGEVGIDGALLGGSGEAMARQIELPGGCVCCALGDELDQTLLDLVAANPGLEAIVLETTGVAEPLPIAWALAREPVAREVRLAAVVTVLDAANFVASRPVSASVDAQVAYADVLLVTKAELVRDRSDAERAESVARMLAPRALIRRGTAAEHAGWLETLLADPELPEAPLSRQIPEPAGELGPHGSAPGEAAVHHLHDEHCRHLDSPAAHGIDSVWLAVEHPVDVEELADQLAELPANYVRIKGIVRSATGETEACAEASGGVRAGAGAGAGVCAGVWMVVHRVGPRVSSEPFVPADRQQARVVALGPGVAVADLARCVAAATQP